MMEIQPLNPRQIEQFIEHYYHDVPERQQFQRELQRRRELRELARVPALLGFILQLWRKRGSVTDDKLELYAQITLELAQQLDREKEGIAPEREWLVEDKDGSLKLDLLRQLAFHQLFKGLIHPPYEVGGNTNDVDRLVFTSEQLRAEAVAFACTLKDREGLTIHPRNLAEDVKATALLRQVGADHYAFAHLTLQEYLAAWQLAKRDNGDTCERIFCRAYFNPTLAEMEVLPMTLGLVAEPDNLYEALEQLPESLDFKGLRLCARGLSSSVRVRDSILKSLADRLAEFVLFVRAGESTYRTPIIQSFVGMKGKADEIVVERISEIFQQPMHVKRGNAAEALGKIKTKRAVDSLLVARHDPDEWVRQRAILSLGESQQEDIVELLVALLREGHTSEKEAAVHALRKIGTERAIEGIKLATHDSDLWVRTIATQVWQEIQFSESVKAQDRNVDLTKTVSTNSKANIPESDVPTLLAKLQDTDSNVSTNAAKELHQLNRDSLVSGLFQAVSHTDEFVREHAVKGLSYLVLSENRKLVEELIRLANTDRSEKVNSAPTSLLQFERKLHYFDIPIPTTTTNNHSLSSPPSPLTAQERAELEPQIAAKYQEVLRGGDARQKGKALEELLAAVFTSIPGFTVSESNYHTATEEIDLVLRNASVDTFWRAWGNLLLVEAKNWQSQRVGKNEYVQFYRKLENRGGHCRLGFLICTERFAETLHKEMLRDSKFALRIVPIDGDDLRRLVAAEDRAAILREFIERAILQ